VVQAAPPDRPREPLDGEVVGPLCIDLDDVDVEGSRDDVVENDGGRIDRCQTGAGVDVV